MTNYHRITPATFCWATGIENTFIPEARPGLRALDEYELTHHYRLWKSDLDLAAETGVQAVRWGIPWYQVQPKPDTWDWRWTDEVLDYAVNVKGLTVILDLMHYGTPLWLDNSFINARYPHHVAAYAAAAAARYRDLIHYYTPFNEPTIAASLCGYKGEWPPYLHGYDGYSKVLLAMARGIVATVQSLGAEQPGMETVQVEAVWHYWTLDPELQTRVDDHNHNQFLALDLCLGRVDDTHPLYQKLQAHGVTDTELAWFRDHAVSFDMLGANFYPWSYGQRRGRRDGSHYRVRGHTPGSALGRVVAAAQARYDLPVMITETSALGSVEQRARWMDETVAAVQDLRRQGIPVAGYTWFPLFSMIDWSYRRGRRPLDRYLIHLGLYECARDGGGFERCATPLVARFREHQAALPQVDA